MRGEQELSPRMNHRHMTTDSTAAHDDVRVVKYYCDTTLKLGARTNALNHDRRVAEMYTKHSGISRVGSEFRKEDELPHWSLSPG